MLSFIGYFNISIFILFTLFYLYQIVYAVVAVVKKTNPYDNISPKKLHRFAVVIAARNESAVIGGLIDSIHKQKYPRELLDIYVIADNCTDTTAQVAQDAGAYVYERFNRQLVGKGYALDYFFKQLMKEKKDRLYDGFFVFDADNLLDENYVYEMNKVFDSGYRVITSYRNSKNYDSNWISAGYSLWFLREAKYLNHPRMLLHTSCAISGTGFLLSSEIVRENNGWKHHLLTEDIEFTIDSVIHGEKIGYCANAMLYDEQPCTWHQSWIQRLRWSKGFYQVFGKYSKDLVKGIFKGKSFACYDMLMTIAPALFVTLTSIVVNLFFLIFGLFVPSMTATMIPTTITAVCMSFLNFYLMLLAFGILTTVTEWKNINSTTAKKIKYIFTFPLFIFTYVPISIAALFQKVEWKPITHSIAASIEECTVTGKR